MGKPVTLDSDDVEILLDAAAAIRHVENALEAVRQDPAMIRLHASGKIGAALDRCNRARGEAIKPDEMKLRPPFGWQPDVETYYRLQRMVAAGPAGVLGNPADFAHLRSYGLCVAGQVNIYVVWGDKTPPKPEPLAETRFKITEQGAAWFRTHNLSDEPLALTAAPKEITNA